MDKNNARAATLDDLTRNIPRDLRAEWPIQWSEDGQHETGHSMAPVGECVHRQREEIERLQRERDEALDKLDLVRKVLSDKLRSGNEIPVRRVALGSEDCDQLRAALGEG